MELLKHAVIYPIYSGEAYCEINGNVPYFSEDEMVTEAFENYSDLVVLSDLFASFICFTLLHDGL